jgi:hypothetical protein
VEFDSRLPPCAAKISRCAPARRRSIQGGNTLVLTHINHSKPDMANTTLEDDRLIEVTANGDVVWEWVASDHVEEFGFSGAARTAIKAAGRASAGRGAGGRGEGASTNCSRVPL